MIAKSADLPALRLPVTAALSARAPKSVAIAKSKGPPRPGSNRRRKRISLRMLKLGLDARLSVPRQTTMPRASISRNG